MALPLEVYCETKPKPKTLRKNEIRYPALGNLLHKLYGTCEQKR